MIRFQDFSFGYNVPLFDGVSLNLKTEEITLLTGENGSGKTTLCRILSGLQKDYQGSLQMNGTEIKTISVKQSAAQMIYLKQEPQSNVVAATPDEDLAIWQSKFQTRLTENNDSLRSNILNELEIQELQFAPFWEMSSGQIKRSALCALLLNPEKYWLMDEPFSGLHAEIVEKLISILQKRKASGFGALIVTHETGQFSKIADRILKIEDRAIKEMK